MKVYGVYGIAARNPPRSWAGRTVAVPGPS